MQAILRQILERATDGDWRPSSSVLADAWPGLVGERLADVTRPVDVDWSAGHLTVETASDSWRRELGRREDELLERIDRILPWDLERLEFRIGAVDPTSAVPAADAEGPVLENRAADASQVETSDDLEETLDGLPDDTADSARRILQHVRDAEDE